MPSYMAVNWLIWTSELITIHAPLCTKVEASDDIMHGNESESS